MPSALPPPPSPLARWVPMFPPAIFGDLNPLGQSDQIGGQRDFGKDMEAYASAVVSGLENLLAAVSTGLDLEALIHHTRVQARQIGSVKLRIQREKKRCQALLRERIKLQQSGRSDASAVAELSSIGSQCERALLEWRRAMLAFENCLGELIGLRTQRLRAYKDEWVKYLDSMKTTAPALADDVACLWSQLESSLSAPEASLTEDGLLMVWDFDKHHLEVEVSSNGVYDWFYRDRSKTGYKGEEGVLVRHASTSLAEILKKFKRAKDRNG